MKPWRSRGYRIIITGSRNWSGPERRAQMRAALAEAIKEAAVLGYDIRRTTIITGDARGADLNARALALELNYRCVVHRADWQKNGKAAGPLRNAEMVKAGADLCLAFPLGGSPGTLDTMRRAAKKGIPVRIRGEVPSEWGKT